MSDGLSDTAMPSGLMAAAMSLASDYASMKLLGRHRRHAGSQARRAADAATCWSRTAASPPSRRRSQADAETIDCAGHFVLPGLINAHMHTWQTALRSVAANWTLLEYFRHVHAGLATVFTPEDIHIATLAGALNQLDHGVTTLVDWCAQQSDARAHRRRHRRPEGKRHPRRLLPRLAQARSQARRAAFLGGAAPAPRDRAPAEGPAGRSQCAGHARHGGAGPALFDARGQRPRFRSGAGDGPGRLHASGRRRGQDAGRLGDPDGAAAWSARTSTSCTATTSPTPS